VTTRAPVTDAIGFAERVVALLDEGQPDCSACWTW